MKRRVIGILAFVVLTGGILAAQEAAGERPQQPQLTQRRMQQMMGQMQMGTDPPAPEQDQP